MAWVVLYNDVSNLLKLIQARNDALRSLAQIECHSTNPKLPPLFHALVFLISCFFDNSIDIQLRYSFVNRKRFLFLGIQGSQSLIPESICLSALGAGPALRFLGRALGRATRSLCRIIFLYLVLIRIWRGNDSGGGDSGGRFWTVNRQQQSPRLLPCV